jgi:hypothetical protein
VLRQLMQKAISITKVLLSLCGEKPNIKSIYSR